MVLHEGPPKLCETILAIYRNRFVAVLCNDMVKGFPVRISLDRPKENECRVRLMVVSGSTPVNMTRLASSLIPRKCLSYAISFVLGFAALFKVV